MEIRTLGLLLLLAIPLVCGIKPRKVRYSKATSRRISDEPDIYGFLRFLDTGILEQVQREQEQEQVQVRMQELEPPAFTTPEAPTLYFPPWTTTTTTESPPRPRTTARRRPERPRRPRDYCLKRKGQFSYPPDCHKYVDCWLGTVFVKTCQPANLVFNPATRQCTWSSNPAVQGLCDAEGRHHSSSSVDSYNTVKNFPSAPVVTDFSLPYCRNFAHLGYECVDSYRCVDGEIRNVSNSSSNFYDFVIDIRSGIRQLLPSGKFSPWRKICEENTEQICCKKPEEQIKRKRKKRLLKKIPKNALCPNNYSGPQPYPPDCSKFTNCWKGTGTVQSCAPGTQFNQQTNQCDHPSKAKCQPQLVSAPVSHFQGHEQQARSGPAKDITFPSPPSGQRVRLRGGKAPYAGYLEIQHSGEWGLVCDSGSWTMKEAEVVCRQLGFPRGVRATTQGLVHGAVNEERKLTENVECSGSENGLEKCNVLYSSFRSGSCKLFENVVSVTCIHDSFAVCPEGEIPFGDSCYSVHFNRSSFHEAQATCQREGKHLVEITNQQENDLLSELLLLNNYSRGRLAQIWTGGMGSRTARSSIYYWHGTRKNMGVFRNWWPGWSGERKGTAEIRGNAMAVKLSRKFNFVSRRKREERLTDYYFWTLEQLHTKLAFICERKKKQIGCIRGNGKDYLGSANRGETGDTCLKWDSPELSFVLEEEDIGNLGPLEGNNFCRNPDNDIAPWCIAPNGEFDYCDIPECEEAEESASDSESGNEVDSMVFADTSNRKCGANQFQCAVGECVLAAYICDGHKDCSNGLDEAGCQRRELDKYEKQGRQFLDVPYLERWLDTSASACATHCKNAKDFTCRSFNYHAAKRLCTLSESNVGQSGRLIPDRQWDYYELSSESVRCGDSLRCPSGKCLTEDQLCDGKNDCGSEGRGEESFDEESCVQKPNLSLRLVEGRGDHEGRVEVRAFDYPFGGICDDGFHIEEANVICRQLGFELGAREALTNSHFGSGSGAILMDELNCQGNETSLLDCHFDPWTKTDCDDNEWAGVVCKKQQEECKHDEEWRCRRSGECIPLDFLCDGRLDCADGSDEAESGAGAGLCGKPVQVRLAGGNNVTSGRVEVRFKGVWGTVCDDNFGEEEGAVICRMLGFEGRALVHSEAAFDPGVGPIWIQNMVCKGDEVTLEDCQAPPWQPSFQCKHLEDVGVECVPRPVVKIDSYDEDLGDDTSSRSGLQCGVPQVALDGPGPGFPVARLAGGLKSQPGAHPWAASIRLQGSSRSFHWCGGVVLSEFHVLTVGHCMEDYPKDVYRIRVGDWDMQIPDLGEQEYRVDTVHFHEEYNVGLYLNNDIALVRIKSDSNGRGFKFGERVVPVCLPHSNVMYGKHLNCTVTGWGSTGISQPGYTRYLQAARIPLLDTEQCMAPTVYGPNKLGSSMLCAGFLEGGVDTCQGDSGGGMVCQVRGRQAILGLTSWGYGCGRPNRPGVYTKVADYLDWIVDKMTL